MTHKIVSFYKNDLNSEIALYQKKVFEKFNIPVLQVPFKTHHHEAIETFLRKEEWDSISILDVDLVPTSAGVFDEAKSIINKSPCIYGNAQTSNSYPYVAPSFLNFTKYTYNKVECDSFCGGFYEDKEIDVAERFSIITRIKNIEIVFSFPEKCLIPLWKCNTGFYNFEFGIGTHYSNNTFHCFEVRKQERQDIFIQECKRILS